MSTLGNSGLVKNIFPGHLYFGENGRVLAEGVWEGRDCGKHQEAPRNCSGPKQEFPANQGEERAPKSTISKINNFFSKLANVIYFLKVLTMEKKPGFLKRFLMRPSEHHLLSLSEPQRSSSSLKCEQEHLFHRVMRLIWENRCEHSL